MPFNYSTGVTTPGAPDEIVDWFATFQAWMIGIGWTVAAGGGTTDVYFNSVGEGPGPALTMLFIHVQRDGGNPNRVLVEVTDDIVPTHTTAEAGYLDGGGVQFSYWICGDMDAVQIVFKSGATYHSIYAGMVMPFALTVPDETYRMIATSTQIAGSILRDHTGVWDVDYGLNDNDHLDDAKIDRFDASFPLCGTYLGANANIAGQLKNVSGLITDPAVPVMTVLTTGGPAASSEWLVVQDRLGNRFAMRTGGVVPTGMPDPGTFAAVSGAAANVGALFAALSAHMTGLGWTDLGDPGLADLGRMYFSAGESGVDEIFIGFAYSLTGTDSIYPYLSDDAAFTNWTALATSRYMEAAEFPINYWICGDRDCVVLVYQRTTGYTMIWSGLLPAFAPGLLPPYAPGPVLSPYSVYFGARGEGPGFTLGGILLRGHDGTWNSVATHHADGAPVVNSNPNAYDGVTYLVWPLLAYSGAKEFAGQLRYVGRSDGGGIANMDTITIAGEVYTVFFDTAGEAFCVRTV